MNRVGWGLELKDREGKRPEVAGRRRAGEKVPEGGIVNSSLKNPTMVEKKGGEKNN